MLSFCTLSFRPRNKLATCKSNRLIFVRALKPSTNNFLTLVLSFNWHAELPVQEQEGNQQKQRTVTFVLALKFNANSFRALILSFGRFSFWSRSKLANCESNRLLHLSSHWSSTLISKTRVTASILIKGLTSYIRILCFVLMKSGILILLCVWITTNSFCTLVISFGTLNFRSMSKLATCKSNGPLHLSLHWSSPRTVFVHWCSRLHAQPLVLEQADHMYK